MCSTSVFLLGNRLFFFVQRPVQRPKTASNVPLRSLWRRSSRLLGFGRVNTKVRSSVWGTRIRAVAGHVEDTVPYPESGQNQKKTNRIGMTTDQKQRGREGEVGLDEFLKANCWSSSVSRKDFAVCTLPFQPSSVTCHYFLFKTRMKGL